VPVAQAATALQEALTAKAFVGCPQSSSELEEMIEGMRFCPDPRAEGPATPVISLCELTQSLEFDARSLGGDLPAALLRPNLPDEVCVDCAVFFYSNLANESVGFNFFSAGSPVVYPAVFWPPGFGRNSVTRFAVRLARAFLAAANNNRVAVCTVVSGTVTHRCPDRLGAFALSVICAVSGGSAAKNCRRDRRRSATGRWQARR
jgi:hypothetical protein